MKTVLCLAVLCLASAAAAPKEQVLLELEDLLENELVLRENLESSVSKKSTTTSLTNAEKKSFLDAHNDARANVDPPAANMLKMQWDSELEATAQAYANRCIWGHNGGRSTGSSFGYVGENLYLTTGGLNANSAVKSWDNEKSKYTYSSLACSGVCGHYTQVVWATSGSLGCGATKCSSVQGLNGWNDVTIVVCNYGKGGNYRGMKPYVQGTACSGCPSGTTCSNGLCSSGDDSSNQDSGSSTGSSGCTCK